MRLLREASMVGSRIHGCRHNGIAGPTANRSMGYRQICNVLRHATDTVQAPSSRSYVNPCYNTYNICAYTCLSLSRGGDPTYVFLFALRWVVHTIRTR